MAPKPRPRKLVSAARIELHFWFIDEWTYREFYAIPLGRKSQSVSDRQWMLPVLAFADGHVEATYRFTHTCRNDGAQRGDSEKFFRAVCNAAGLDESRARLLSVRLISREKFRDTSAEPIQAPIAVAPAEKVDDRMVERLSRVSLGRLRALTALQFELDHDYVLYGH
ncbi:hypothetical protein LVJ59_02760 [Microbacterium sp. KKR3/1]|uniref:hypothetical protein n=1 Tax=Microbacterium sp. KKR3/1 TaxID=2904241 RepID=UPI001E2DCC74|nr:hypothetical protein [Microbacterium sp. KKR3/1]MCE0507945.1 hypothetical protein [Microbacterium sp. KKR3/1]